MERQLVDEYAAFAVDEYAQGRLSKDSYHKVCVTLASEYLKDFADVDAAMEVFNRVEPEYFLQVLPKALEEDPLYASIMLEFLYHLERWGIMNAKAIRPTQASANA
jgi:hypothetical protein